MTTLRCCSMARIYEKSQKLADLTSATVQKDVWHLLRDGRQVQQDLERSAYRAMRLVLDLERKLGKAWSETDFVRYMEAVDKEAWAITQFDAYAELLPYLADALEMVDWRAGEIRDRQTADWLLTETLILMNDLTDKRIQRFVGTVRNHQHQLLTCLDWVAADLPEWQARLSDILPVADEADAFQRTVARHWRLQQMLINGHPPLRTLSPVNLGYSSGSWSAHFPCAHWSAVRTR